jgi:hypothetical protein
LAPTVNGEVHHFDARGLYDGLALLWDRESDSWWNHITGYAVHGPLRGQRLKVSNVLHSTVGQTLENDPSAEIAISGTAPERRRPWSSILGRLGSRLSSFFKQTIDAEDDRLPDMDVGIGIWGTGTERYYSMDVVTERGRFVIDELDGRNVAVYFDPAAHALTAIYTEATGGHWEDDDLVLNNGTKIRNGLILDGDGERTATEHPMQLFTRWYGFALTFPETEIYQP